MYRQNSPMYGTWVTLCSQQSAQNLDAVNFRFKNNVAPKKRNKSVIYIYIHTHAHTYTPSSLSCRTANMDLPDSLSPPVSIVHCSREVFQTTSCIGTELLYRGSSWLSNLCSSMWRGPWEYVAYEFVLTSPAVFCMSGSSNLDSFHDGW